MNECIHKTNYFLLFILLLLYGGTLSINVMLMINKNDYQLTNYFYFLFLIDSIIIIIVIFFTILFGVSSFFFSSKEKLLYYILTLIFMICVCISISFLLYQKIFYEELHFIIQLFYGLNCLEIIICIFSLIFSIIERNALIQEIKESPLNYIDEYITEDMYNNILSQSQNPNNRELKEDFIKYVNKNKVKKFES